MEIAARNEVLLVGRVSTAARAVDLPSGDRLTSFRLVVDRSPSRRPVPEGVKVPTVDVLDCVAWSAGLQRTARTWQPGDMIEVHGAVHRRFYRTAGGVQSRWEVAVSRAKRVSRAGLVGKTA
ncbi:MAG: Single-stranded DNA-binding protein [Frankiales bacterium]|nr:Single-stranded DNA-binding protein [Frankiales bacterium]